MELPFAGVHQLCAPMFARLNALPKPQRDALSVALGRSSGGTPDRFLVALAVLSLLSAVAEEQPLLCLVDDAQWLDEASDQVLGFVARRLVAESVAIVLAVREPRNRHEFDGLPELSLGGLEEEEARALLASAVPGLLDARVRDRIIAETRGNPLALLELPRSVSAAELAGGFPILAAGDLPGHIEGHYLRRVGGLPRASQQLMLLAAADPVGDATLLWRAAEKLGIDASALAPAQDAQLLEIEARVRFRHPLVRSAVYQAASPGDRQGVHRVLAMVSDPEADADRRAWHRALAAAGPDEEVAAELEHSAGRAQARGGLAAAAAFLQRAVALTRDPRRRTERALAAADFGLRAGAFDAARGMMAAAEIGPLDELQHARLDLLRAEASYSESRGSTAPALLLRAAKALESLDPQLARETYLDAWSSALFAGGLAGSASLHDVSREARSARMPAERRASVRRAAGRVFARVHRGPLSGGAGARAGRGRLCGRACLARGSPPLGVARNGGRRDGVGSRDLPGGGHARGRGRPRGGRAHRAGGQCQRDGASDHAGRRVRQNHVAGLRGRCRHRGHGRPGGAVRRPRARRLSGPRDPRFSA